MQVAYPTRPWPFPPHKRWRALLAPPLKRATAQSLENPSYEAQSLGEINKSMIPYALRYFLGAWLRETNAPIDESTYTVKIYRRPRHNHCPGGVRKLLRLSTATPGGRKQRWVAGAKALHTEIYDAPPPPVVLWAYESIPTRAKI